MANDLSDLFKAIDDYMLQNGNVSAMTSSRILLQNYHVNVDDSDSPLNVNSGPLKVISESFTKFSHEIDKSKHILESVTKQLNNSFKTFTDFQKGN